MKRNPVITILVALLLTTGPVLWATGPQAAETDQSTPSEVAPAEDLRLDEALPLDPQITVGRLDNGLTYFIRTNEKPENRADLWLAVNAGSMQEDDDQLGLAHFVEHMAFNGTTHFEKQELIDYLERIGMRFGPDINAYTSFDETVYMLRVPTDDEETMKQGFQILEDWARGVSFEEEEIDKERGVVIEEWRLHQGAESRVRDKQFPVLFKDSRYADRLTIGDPEIIETASYDTVRRFYRDWYRPDLMAVIAVGDFDPEAVEALIKKHFAGLVGPDEPRPREIYPVPDHEETLFAITTDPELTLTNVGVYYKLERLPEGTRGAYRKQIVEQLYHGMVNARLDELRQQADPPFLYGYSTSAGFVRSKDVYVQLAGVEEGQMERGLGALLTEVERVDRHGFTQTELERMKADLLRSYERAFEERDKRDSQSFTSEYLRHFFEGEPSPGIEVELELAREFLPGISLAELNHLAAEWISESNRVILASGPEKEAVSLPTEDQLAAVFKGVEASEIDTYVDEVRKAPLLAQIPEPGKIVERTEIPEIGVTEWRLDNGVRVVLKPTDFKNDQVLLSSFSPGGHSLVPDEDFVSASFADTLVGNGGLGEFSQIELDKALAGKLASAQAYINELEEGITASSSPKDLETMFQLYYLSATAPRKDTETFEAFVARVRAILQNRQAQPDAVFSDEVTLAMFDGHPRRQPPTLEMIDKLDLDLAFEVFRDRFADLDDLTAVIVGAFELDTIEPLVETYLGSLPATDREETWRDVGAQQKEGLVAVEVKKGLEPKSSVKFSFAGPAAWSREAVYDMGSLSAALRIRLREVLREDLGATYGVAVGGQLTDRPRERFGFSIGFGCAPENVVEMLATLFLELDVVRENGLNESYADKVKEIQRRQRETNLKENSFWLGSLKFYYSNDWDPRLILDYESLVERTTPERLRDSARKYLDMENYLQAVLFPENWETEPATDPGS
ncbi:MAG: insulinase family protein [Acidobacteria bacterium]|nr:MAG: insulinase family protein [Acidobacteriota bacterium]